MLNPNFFRLFLLGSDWTAGNRYTVAPKMIPLHGNEF